MPNITYCFEPHCQHSLLPKVDATWLGSYTARILNRAPSGSLAGVTGTKKKKRSLLCQGRVERKQEHFCAQNEAINEPGARPEVGRLAKGQDEAYCIFHWSCVIRSVTYPINHSFMVTDAGQLCKTFWTALVGWDSQAFTLGKHPEKHFKMCISTSEIAFKNENTLLSGAMRHNKVSKLLAFVTSVILGYFKNYWYIASCE